MSAKCPICKGTVEKEGEFFPFCSERCKTIDLANWATGEYKISRYLNEEELSTLKDELYIQPFQEN